jgi:hypothetical protein
MDLVVQELVKMAKLYKESDTKLGIACGDSFDPIACTIYAKNGQHLDNLPLESIDAGFYLTEVVKLHGILVQQYNMDTDEVRQIWFPILNA